MNGDRIEYPGFGITLVKVQVQLRFSSQNSCKRWCQKRARESFSSLKMLHRRGHHEFLFFDQADQILMTGTSSKSNNSQSGKPNRLSFHPWNSSSKSQVPRAQPPRWRNHARQPEASHPFRPVCLGLFAHGDNHIGLFPPKPAAEAKFLQASTISGTFPDRPIQAGRSTRSRRERNPIRSEPCHRKPAKGRVARRRAKGHGPLCC